MMIKCEDIILEVAKSSDKKLIFDMLINPKLISKVFDEKHPAPTWEEFDDASEKHLYDGIALEKGSYLLIKYNEKVIGSISYACDVPKRKIAELDIWMKSKKYTGKGLGVKSINCLTDYLYKQFHISTFIIRPWIKNTNAIKAYNKCGFIELENFNAKDYYSDEHIEKYGDGDYGIEETINLIKEYK